MNRLINLFPVLTSLVVYVLLWLLMRPVLGFNLDSDCVAYLTIAEKVAAGDYLRGVNGLWSPLNSWILALFIRRGYHAWEAAKWLNFFFGFVIIIQSYFLFVRFRIQRSLLFYLEIALSIAMVYFVYFQMFGDLLQLIFVLFYLLILLRNPIAPITWKKAILLGIIMGCGFYAKAFSFFFLCLHFFAILAWYVYGQKMVFRKAAMVYLVGIGTAILMMLPWTFAMHQKYHEWSLNGHAGKLNMSWYINSGKSFKSDIKVLIPPSYDDSPSFWEDPYLSQSDLSSPFSSMKHFVKWTFRIVHTCMVAIFCFQEISFLACTIILFAFYFFFFKKKIADENDSNFSMQLVFLTICALPIGYLMMHIETRYIWLNVILLMLIGGMLLQSNISMFKNKIAQHSMYLVFAFSFALFPIFQFENLKFKNKDLFDMAEDLNAKNIHGKFTSNHVDAGRMWVVAYLTKSNYFTIENTKYSASALHDEMKRYGVRYYFNFLENNIGESQIEGMKKITSCEGLEIFEFVN